MLKAYLFFFCRLKDQSSCICWVSKPLKEEQNTTWVLEQGFSRPVLSHCRFQGTTGHTMKRQPPFSFASKSVALLATKQNFNHFTLSVWCKVCSNSAFKSSTFAYEIRHYLLLGNYLWGLLFAFSVLLMFIKSFWSKRPSSGNAKELISD